MTERLSFIWALLVAIIVAGGVLAGLLLGVILPLHLDMWFGAAAGIWCAPVLWLVFLLLWDGE